MKYVCKMCGHVYDPKEGDLEVGVEPGAVLEDLPYDWECPVCEVGKDMLEKQE